MYILYTHIHHTYIHTDRQTDRQTDGQTHVRTYIHTHTHIYIYIYEREAPLLFTLRLHLATIDNNIRNIYNNVKS